ncbi:MAG TPA: ABC transporter permease, partial [Phycisphaerales bacterium]|nr:ABC transporter permease [Phycisphaerales bacterium]
AAISVTIGTLYGTLAGYLGGRWDALMMRVVDVLYGLPYVLLVVLLAVAGDTVLDRLGPMHEGTRTALEVGILLLAIGSVSWLTVARVVRGQVLSLKQRPFMEAARAMGVPFRRQLFVHLLPNLVGVIVVYATLTVPQAILQESFLSFLGIGVRPPLPSWGNLAAEGLGELNPVRVRWWLLVFPCVLLAGTLLSLNFVGEGLREAVEPKRRR